MENLGLYMIITAPKISAEEVAKICVEKKIKMLQIREKNLTDKQILDLAKSLKQITKGTDTKLIINDRIDIALLSDADGVHLGQDDLSIEDARKILGKDKIIGLSTHSIAQAKLALEQKPDYIGFGPIHPTPTKAIPDPAVGYDLLKQVVEFANVPVVAIGGITLENLPLAFEAGAKSFCAVRPFMNTLDLRTEIDGFLTKIAQFN